MYLWYDLQCLDLNEALFLPSFILFKDDRIRLLFCISNQFYAKFSWDKEFNRGCNLWGEFLNNFSNIFHFSCWWNSSGFIEKKTIIVKKIMIGTTGCPNKHGNSVTNSISSFKIILWFSIVIPTEKAVICKSFVCYVRILFVYVLIA